MPREKIQDEAGLAQVHVAWSHEQYLQVATVSTSPKDFVEWCRNVVAEYDEKGELHQSLGMFWTPTRYQVNELIRVLRRARDHAFGRDE